MRCSTQVALSIALLHARDDYVIATSLHASCAKSNPSGGVHSSCKTRQQDARQKCLCHLKSIAANGEPQNYLSFTISDSNTQSWSPRNLYNIYRRSLTELRDETIFTESEKTIFQQRWASKRLTRAYHGDFINEKIFKRWYLPSTLPDVRPHRRRAGDDREALNKWSLRPRSAAKEAALREEDDKLAQAPVASLMYEEVERRIDVFIFRCCFTHSVYEARRMVIHGRVKLNGKKVRLLSSSTLSLWSDSSSIQMRIPDLLQVIWSPSTLKPSASCVLLRKASLLLSLEPTEGKHKILQQRTRRQKIHRQNQ